MCGGEFRDAMGMKKDCSGREKTLRRSLRKAGSIQEPKALVKEARSDWRVAEMGLLCFFGCRRLGDLVMIRVEDVT